MMTSTPNFFGLYKPNMPLIFYQNHFLKFSLLKKILTFALRIGSICLVLSGSMYWCWEIRWKSIHGMVILFKEIGYSLWVTKFEPKLPLETWKFMSCILIYYNRSTILSPFVWFCLFLKGLLFIEIFDHLN